MKLNSPLFLFLISAVVGYASGLGLEVLVEGEMAKANQFVYDYHYTFYSMNSIIKSAEMSSDLQSVIDSASIGWGVDALLIDEQGEKYFKNIVNECKFHSPESILGFDFPNDNIDDGICIVCKILGEDAYNILGKGQLDLPNGYDSSETEFIEIPDEDMVQVGSVARVEILIQSVILDFTGLADGETLSDQYFIDFGIWIEGKACPSSNCLVSELVDLPLQVYNTNPPDGADPDLEVGLGNISIIPHDDNGNGVPDLPANDSPHGGEQRFIFYTPRHVNSMIFVDADRGSIGNDIGDVTTYGNTDCSSNQIGSPIDIISLGDGSTQILVTMNTDKVQCLKVAYRDSGGVASINLGCPLSTDPVD